MSQRYYPKDVRRAVERLQDRMWDAGLLRRDAKLIYEEGSQTYGRAHRIYWQPAGKSVLYNHPAIDDYLGWTAAEAYAVIRTASQMLATMRHVQEGDEWVKRNLHLDENQNVS